MRAKYSTKNAKNNEVELERLNLPPSWIQLEPSPSHMEEWEAPPMAGVAGWEWGERGEEDISTGFSNTKHVCCQRETN